jgi:long-chain acyl-CoA synthetase
MAAMRKTEKGDTWPKVLAYNCHAYGDKRKAMRYKHYGIWRSYTWKDYYLEVKYTALGLLALGFEAGNRLLIVGDNAHQWYAAELAAQVNRGVSVGAYSELTAFEVQHLVQDSQAAFAIVEDQEQVDKLLEIKDETPLLRRIVYWNYKGLVDYDDPILLGYRELLQLGQDYEKEHQGLFEANLEAGTIDDACALVYTPGTTGDGPRAVLHTYRTMIAAVDLFLQFDPWREEDNVVPFLPPAWIAEQLFAVGCHLLSGAILNLAEEPGTLLRDAREIEPTIVFYGARMWEGQAAGLQSSIIDVTGLKNLAFRSLMPLGYRMADLHVRKEKPGTLLRMGCVLADVLLFKRMRERLGLSRVRTCYSTGATLSADASRFYHALGIPIKNVYVTTEGGFLSCPQDQDIDPATLGRPIPGVEMGVTEKNEIVFRRSALFTVDGKDGEVDRFETRDGWFPTGDMGLIRDDGHLVLLDRTSSIVELKNEESLLPQFVESRLRSSPYVKDAWVFAGPSAAYVSAVIVINYDAVTRWATQMKSRFSSFTELSQDLEVYGLVKKEIARVNAELSPGSRIRKYVQLNREFDPAAGEVTRTRNLRRQVLEENYRGLIDAIYADRDDVAVEASIGPSGLEKETKHVVLRIESVEGASS